MSFTTGHLTTGVILGILVIVNFILLMVYVVGGHQSALQTREFPAIKYESNVITVDTATYTVKSSDSGSIYSVEGVDGGVSITLPDPSKGDVYTFKVRAAAAGSSIFISTKSDTAGVQTFDGGIITASPTTAQNQRASGDNNQIALTGDVAATLDGTEIKILGISGVSWLVSGNAMVGDVGDVVFQTQS